MKKPVISWSLGSWVVGSGILILLGTWIAAISLIRDDRNHDISNAFHNTSSLASVLERHISGTLLQVESSLYELRRNWESGIGIQEMHTILEHFVSARSDLFNLISIIDDQGNVLVTNQKEFKPTYSGDRPFFIYHRDHDNRTIYAGKPLLGRLTGKWFIPISLRLKDAHGKFAGVLLASVNPFYFSEIFREANLERECIIYLADKKGSIYSGIKNGENLQLDVVISPKQIADVFARPANTDIIGKSLLDGKERIQSKSFLHVLPMVISVEVGRKEWLERTDARARRLLIIQVLLSAFIVFIIFRLRRSILSLETLTQTLKTQKNRLNDILEGTHTSTWEWNVQTGAVIVNEMYLNIIGFTSDELPPLNIEIWKEKTHPDDLQKAMAALNRHFCGETEIYEEEIRMKHKDGHWVWVQARGKVASWTEDDKPLWMYGTHQDISMRKKAELALKESEENLRVTLQSIGDAVIATDTEGKITGMNPIAEELTGWKTSDAQGHTLSEVFRIVNSLSRAKVESPARKVLETGEIALLAKHTVLISKTGKEYRIADSGAPIHSANGEIIGVVLVFRDVTEEYATQEKLMQSQKMDAIGQLAGGVAHDFNNMLGGILGAAELLSRKCESVPVTRKYIDIIINSSRHAADLTSKLLAFARKQPAASTPIEINCPIQDALALLERTIDRRIKINVSLTPGNYRIIGDHAQLQSACLNMFINAAHAMPDGGIISVSTRAIDLDEEYCATSTFDIQAGRYMELEIRDTGCGIQAENLQHIFEPFFTTRETGKGTGLGLAAVFGTVQQYKGAIEVHSTVNVGTAFRILLPLFEEQNTETINDTSQVITGRGKIMIVDDEPIMRITAEAILQELGYETITAENGREAIEKFKLSAERIDLVIIDMVMPEMNGRDCFCALKEIRPDLKAILSTGFARDEDISFMKNAGLKGFIQKPFTLATLSRIVSDAINS